MKYKVTLNNTTYEIEVEHGQAILQDEYEAATFSAAPVAAPAAAPAAVPAAAPAPAAPAPAPVAAPAPVPAAPAAPAAPVAGEQVTSPMPGNILGVKVNVGDSVKAGDTLVVLEAMKMENDIVAPHDGKVLQIAVQKGATVDTGTLLAVIG